MKRIFSIPTLPVAIFMLMMAALTSCSTPDTLNVVPDDAIFAATLNLNDALKDNKVEFTKDGITLPGDANDLLDQISDENIEMLVAIHDALNLDGITFFSRKIKGDEYDHFNTYTVIAVKDAKALENFLTDQCDYTKKSRKGFDVYSGKHHEECVVADGLLWLFDRAGDNIVSEIKSVIKATEKGKFIDDKNVKNILNSGNFANAVVKNKQLYKLMESEMRYMDATQAMIFTNAIKPYKDGLTTFTASLEGTTLNSRLQFFNKDGDVIETPALTEIDPAAFKYIPDDFQLSYALAYDDKNLAEALKQVEALIGQIPGNEGDAARTLLADLKNLQGSACVAMKIDFATIASGNSLPSFIGVIPMKQGKASQFINHLTSQAPQFIPSYALNSFDFKPGKITCNLGRNQFVYIQAIDNEIVISNIEVDKNATNTLAETYKGHLGGVVINAPGLAKAFNLNIDADVYADIFVNRSDVTSKIEVKSDNKTLVELIYDVYDSVKPMLNSRSSYSYDDYYEPAESIDYPADTVPVDYYDYEVAVDSVTGAW